METQVVRPSFLDKLKGVGSDAEAKAARKKKILQTAGVVVAIVLGYGIYSHFTFISTDNAQVQANTVLLAPKVSGYIMKVNVIENQKVKAGEVLAEIDSRDYQNSKAELEGQMVSLQAREIDAEKNFKRLNDLVRKGAVSRQQYDSAEASYRELSARLKGAQAQVDQAQLNLDYTQIKAPTDGVIAKRSAEVGMLAAVGNPIFGFVSAEERWVTANFKETEIPDIAPGREAKVTVDAIPGQTFKGVVQSLSPSTGATFTLLPPDNATGNFTKVVQRVPVRIKLLDLTPQDVDKLQAGLSANVTVRIR